MVEDKTSINFNSKNAAAYDELASKAVFSYNELFVMALSYLTENKNASDNGLIVGCGTGMELKTFGNLMPNLKMTGVDPSEEMIKHSQIKLNQYNLNDRVSLHQGFVDSLPDEAKYDFATLIFVLRFIPNAESQNALFNSISKRLKPGAKFIIIDQFGNQESKEFNYLFDTWKNFMMLGGSPSDLVNKIAHQASEKIFIDEQKLKKQLSKNGFENFNCIYSSLIHRGWIVKKKV